MRKTSLLLILLSLCVWVSAQDALTIGPSGKVGINNDTPQTELDVNGTVKANNLQSPQLDYIYAGNQVILDSWEGDLTPGELIWVIATRKDFLFGSPNIPNPENYELFYYLSARKRDLRPSYSCYIFLNHRIAINFRQSDNSPFWYNWQQFPEEKIQDDYYLVKPEGINFYISGSGPSLGGIPISTRVRISNLTVHYVYIRKGVSFSKIDGLTDYPW